MKAFILKNNEGLYYTTHFNNYEEIHTKDISVASIFNRKIADSMKLFLNKSTYPYDEKWKVVEITITEGDLEKEIRKQVCDEIRQALNKEDFWLYGDNNQIINIHEDKFNEILDQIEKGE